MNSCVEAIVRNMNEGSLAKRVYNLWMFVLIQVNAPGKADLKKVQIQNSRRQPEHGTLPPASQFSLRSSAMPEG